MGAVGVVEDVVTVRTRLAVVSGIVQQLRAGEVIVLVDAAAYGEVDQSSAGVALCVERRTHTHSK